MHRDNAQQVTNTAGAGAYALSGTVESTPVLALDDVCVSGKKYRFKIERAGSEVFELIEGTFSSGTPSTVSRDRLIQSSTGSPIVWEDAADKIITLVAPAEDLGPLGWRHHTIAAAGGPVAFTGTSETPAPVLEPGMRITVVMPQTNGDNPTFNFNTLGAKPIRKDGTTLAVLAGEMPAGAHVDLTYDAAEVWVATNIRRAAPAGVKVISTDTYAVVAADIGQFLVFTHASGCDVTLPEAVGSFAAPFWFSVQASGGGDVVLNPTTSFIDGVADIAIAPDGGGSVHSSGGHYYTRRDLPAAVAPTVAVRQTVLSGPVTTDGLPNFGGSTGSTTVTASGTLVATAANGNDNRVGTIVNPSWTGLSTNGTMFLYLDIAADGTCTPGAGTLAPTYRLGGADVTTNGQFTFNVQEMVGKVGNGAAAVQTYRVHVGEVTVAGGVVSAIVWYALMGRYVSPFTATLPGVSIRIQYQSNIGTNEIYGIKTLELECTTIDLNWAVGDRMVNQYGSGAATAAPIQLTHTRLGIEFTTTTGAAFYGTNKTTGGQAVLTAASWKYRVIIDRGW